MEWCHVRLFNFVCSVRMENIVLFFELKASLESVSCCGVIVGAVSFPAFLCYVSCGYGIYYTSSLVAVVTVVELLSEYIYETGSQITDVTDYETTQVETYWIGSDPSHGWHMPCARS